MPRRASKHLQYVQIDNLGTVLLHVMRNVNTFIRIMQFLSIFFYEIITNIPFTLMNKFSYA